jgi:hypothetical protein
VSLRLEQSDYYWGELANRVDWYRENAGPEIAERFVNAVQATLAALTERLGLAGPDSKSGQNWPGCAPSAWNGPFTVTSFSTASTPNTCLPSD